MPTELSTLLATVGTSVALVKEALPLVDSIKSGWLARNESTKKELQETIDKLRQAVRDTGTLAHHIEGYLRTLENIKELLFICKRVEHLVTDNLTALRNRTDIYYQSTWDLVDLLMESLDRERTTSRMAFLDRISWYDDKDKHQMEMLLRQFAQAFERASGHRETRAADNLLYRMQDMTGTLQNAEALLKDTIYDKSLRTLQSLQV
ncbi:hypothetical protein SAMN02746041_01978 [Desulfacinum hydrothermale DSM 13146]|uniref:Uncharacterized protein n=1 Tax=Desulfacinum hydrothermale DSM 13146 TaxID=1121390 RepID=A0A1W1XLF9_9BACT|nr:hypothetical protein [Desulfacinum hydrothermale]SMC24381.1 hypothetical protein SAMN02746041_01978 [Desulfacinum hydrothermale DSM 13146]